MCNGLTSIVAYYINFIRIFFVQGTPLRLLWTGDLTSLTDAIEMTSTIPSEDCVSSVSKLVSTTRYSMTSPSVFGPVSTVGGLDTVATILIGVLVVVLLIVTVSVPVCVLLIAKRRSHHSPDLHNKMDSQTGKDQTLTGNKLHGDASAVNSTNNPVMYESIDELLEQAPVPPSRGYKQLPLEELHKKQDSDLLYAPVDEYTTHSAAAEYYSNDDIRVDCIPANLNSAYGVTLGGGQSSNPNIDTSSNMAYGVATSNAITNEDNDESDYL